MAKSPYVCVLLRFINVKAMKKDGSCAPLMVTIRCLTYNHEPYIRQCLDGFVMQKTNFRFEAIVHDDASTDGTAAIIREYAEKYPDIIRPIYETENQYSKHDGSIRKIMDAHTRGKYIAVCEGDDYWIDPLKLQKQVDFMEKHPEYTLSHTAFKFYYQNNSVFKEFENKKTEEYSEDLLISAILDDNSYRIQTNTALYPFSIFQDILNENPFLFSGFFLMGDTQLWCCLASRGKVHYLKDITAVYRVADGSACRSLIPKKKYRFHLSCWELRWYLFDKLKIKNYRLKVKITIYYIYTLLRYMLWDIEYSPAYKPWGYYPCHYIISKKIFRHILSSYFNKKVR